MKLLWTTNTLPPIAAERCGASIAGHWMWCLLEILRKEVQKITIVTEQERAESFVVSSENVEVIVIGVRRPFQKWIPKGICSKSFRDCIASIDADIIHVHGTEHPYALSCRLVRPSAPIAVSVQGLVGMYAPYMTGKLGVIETTVASGIFSALRGTSPIGVKTSFSIAAGYELENLRAANVAICRTSWDAGFVASHLPGLRIEHGDEALRCAFERRQWVGGTGPTYSPRLLFTNGASPVKNVSEILQACAYLKMRGFLPTLRLAGFPRVNSGYVQLIREKAKQLDVDGMVEFLGYLTAEEMVDEMLDADLYVNSSLIDNSPNSVCEAQLVGIPVVSSAVGGVIDLVQNGQSGLLYQSGQPEQLAECIARIALNTDLAMRLSRAGRQQALSRHAHPRIRNQYLKIYEDLGRQCKKDSSP